MDTFPVFVLLLCCTVRAKGTKMTLLPETQTVLRGEETRFTCRTTQPQWGAMIWQLNGRTVLTIHQKHGIVPSINPNITAEKSSTPQEDGWVLVLKNTNRQQQGDVTCDLQDVDKKTASLFVQEKGSVRVLGEMRLALKGQSVEFECQAAGWYPQPTLQWQLNGRKVSSDDYNVSTEESGQSLFSVSSNLSVMAATSCAVECLVSVSAMNSPLISRVRLTVVAEVVQEEDDCTIPLALTASLSALLLLALLCICTVLCYRQRRRTKPGLQHAIRFNQSVRGGISVAGATEGMVNLGYSNDTSTDAIFTELIIGACSQMTDSITSEKVPDVVSSGSQSFQSDSQDQESTKNIRRITTV